MSQARKHQSPSHRQAAYRARLQTARRLQLESQGLPALPAISTMPGVARWNTALLHAAQILSTVQSEMESYFDDRTELWQESERGVLHLERMSAVEALVDALGELG